MSKKDWWIAASTMSILAAGAGVAQTPLGQVGVVGSVNPEATGQLANAQGRVLFIGNQVFQDERVATGASGQTHLLFLDQSTLTVGPNSEVVLDRFVYDPEADSGQLAMTATRGVARYIGGKISKKTEVTVRTPSATLGIRGGVALVSVGNDGSTSAVFLHGVALNVTSLAGGTQTITRPGFFVQVAPGAPPTAPGPPPPGLVSGLLTQLAGPSRGAPPPPAGIGGSTLPPSDTAPSRIIDALTPPPGGQTGDQAANRTVLDSGRTLDILREVQSGRSHS
jgi:hypothetical protein